MEFRLRNMGLKQMAIYSSILVLVAAGSAFLGVMTVVIYQVYWGDVSDLKKSTILARINEETTIYTLDEETRLGSFFDSAHRTYVPISEVPAHMIRAIVASEDKNFYNHIGVDPFAILGAFIDGVANGFRFRRGGSSITQQTVKNILDRREHSFKRKFKEMIRALQLERMYSKNQIIEFYLNQFHVTANGNGIGIAAKYYFNKDVRDLDLVEAAFIAGSVKAPSKYNPFIKYSREAREKAWVNADERKNYVLRRMYQQGWITKEELKGAWNTRVPFRKGKFRTSEVALVSLVRNQLNRKEILEALQLDSLRELDHAGLKIYTTLDAKLQEKAQLMMRRNLSRLETILKGFSTEKPDKFRPLRSLEVNQFYYGKVKALRGGPKPSVEISFGLPTGTIPYESLVRTAKHLNLPTYKGWKFHMKEIVGALKPGDVVFVEVMEYDKEGHDAVLELRRYPGINGGLIAVDKGEVRAVVAGFEAKGFNRAMFATRQPGSVFKSVVYFAALQLGWTIVDRVDNQRRVFPFQGKYYFPRPDHVSPFREVSLLWAGTKSENLGSIYLAANLLEKLNFGQFKQLMGRMGLLPRPGEAPQDYHYRVAKEIGVQLDKQGIREYTLGQAIYDLKPDLVFSGQKKLLYNLSRMWWGTGYVAEMGEVWKVPREDIKDKERALRVDLLKNNYLRMGKLAAMVASDWAEIRNRVLESGPESLFSDPVMSEKVARFRVLASRGHPALAYTTVLPEELPPDQRNDELFVTPVTPPGRPMNGLDIQAVWGDGGDFGGRANVEIQDVRLEGFLPLKYFNQVRARLEERVDSILSHEEKYHLYRYFNHHDFRIALGLRYLVELSKAMGAYSKLEPVLSFPLGTNDVSVAEVAKIYQTFTDGKIYRFFEEGPNNQLSFVRRIEDRDGNVLYEPQRQEFQLVDPCIASQVSEILGKVVTHGTGRRARGELQIVLEEAENQLTKKKRRKPTSFRVPAFGKTGTTNDYTTAYFAGFLPYPTAHRQPLSTENSYVIASYVGYDLNKTMKRGPYRISGAYGALPVWSDFGKSIISEDQFVEYLDQLDLSLIKRRVWPVNRNKCTRQVRVDLPRGTVMGKADANDVEVFTATNIETEGENFVNEFARNPSVRSFIHLATVTREGVRHARRTFEPFRFETGQEDEVDPEVGKDETLDRAVPRSGDAGGSAPAPKTRANDRVTRPPAVPKKNSQAMDNLQHLYGKEKPPADQPDSATRENEPGPVLMPAPADQDQGSTRPGSIRKTGESDEDPGYTEEELW